MRDNLLKIPVDPANQDKGDLYDNIETRPDTTEKQKETGRSAYTELLEAHARWAGGTLLGCDFPSDFREKGGTSFLNQTIKSGHELAIMAQILRDPRYETLRIFYTQKDLIIHHTAISSRLPGAVYLDKIGPNNHDLGVLVEKTKRHVKAMVTGYYTTTHLEMLRHRVPMSDSQRYLHPMFLVLKATWLSIPVNIASLIKMAISILWIGWVIRQEAIRIFILKVMNCSWRK